MPQMSNGQTISLKCYDCKQWDAIDSTFATEAFLAQLTRHINMNALGAPYSHHLVLPEYPEYNGISCTQHIMESHLTIHTWAESREAWVVVASCGKFFREQVVDFLGEKLKPAKIVLEIIQGVEKYYQDGPVTFVKQI